MKNFISSFIKYAKIVGFTALFILGVVLSIVLFGIFNKKKSLLSVEKYQEKINNIMSEKKENEKIIANSSIDDYDEHGNYIAGKRKRKS